MFTFTFEKIIPNDSKKGPIKLFIATSQTFPKSPNGIMNQATVIGVIIQTNKKVKIPFIRP